MNLSSLSRSLVALVLLTAPALAGSSTYVDTFSGGVNEGGWTYGPPPTISGPGGNPDAFMSSLVDTFAPQLRTSGASDFTGDYRSRNVVSLGVDLKTFATQFPAARECTLMLSNGSCSVYLLGIEQVPQPGAGWVSFDFSIDPHSTVLPTGWALNGLCHDPNAAWNTVIEDVTQVTIFYGDPTFFYIFDQWGVGADNLRITAEDPWEDLGGGTPGFNGQPQLTGLGPLTAGSSVGVELVNGPPLKLALLWIALSPVPFAALGGTVEAFPFNSQLLVETDASGRVAGGATMPAAASGTAFTFQFLCQDLSTLHGLTLSNGVRGTVP